MNVVDYPSNLKTDEERLFAVYNLIEQVRLYSNDFVQTVPKELKRSYIRGIVKPRLKLLLHERNLLKRKIILANYTLEEWDKLPIEDADHVYLDLFGDRNALKSEKTKATSSCLDEIKSVDIGQLTALETTDPTEDLTTYTEADTGGYFTVIADKVTWTAMPLGTDDHYVYKDKTASHFDGDFEHLLQVMCTNGGGGGEVGFWCLANAVEDILGLYNTAHHLGFFVGDNIYLRERSISYQDSANTLLNQIYYLEIERDEAVGTYGTLYIYICDDDYWDDGGNQIDTLSVTLQTAKVDFQYIYACISNAYGSGLAHSGYMQYLDLQEGAIQLGAATLVGVGTLAGIGRGIFIGQSTLAGTGTLASIGRKILTGLATLAGTGTLAGIGNRIFSGLATLAGTGTLAIVGRKILSGLAILAGVGTLGAVGRKILTGALTLLGVGTLTAAGEIVSDVIAKVIEVTLSLPSRALTATLYSKDFIVGLYPKALSLGKGRTVITLPFPYVFPFYFSGETQITLQIFNRTIVIKTRTK